MKLDIKCDSSPCEAHYEVDDCGSQSQPTHCSYCGSTYIIVINGLVEDGYNLALTKGEIEDIVKQVMDFDYSDYNNQKSDTILEYVKQK